MPPSTRRGTGVAAVFVSNRLHRRRSGAAAGWLHPGTGGWLPVLCLRATRPHLLLNSGNSHGTWPGVAGTGKEIGLCSPEASTDCPRRLRSVPFRCTRCAPTRVKVPLSPGRVGLCSRPSAACNEGLSAPIPVMKGVSAMWRDWGYDFVRSESRCRAVEAGSAAQAELLSLAGAKDSAPLLAVPRGAEPMGRARIRPWAPPGGPRPRGGLAVAPGSDRDGFVKPAPDETLFVFLPH